MTTDNQHKQKTLRPDNLDDGQRGRLAPALWGAPSERSAQRDSVRHKEAGAALFYILIAVALLGMLSFTMTRQAGQEGGLVGQMSSDKARILSGDIMNHVTVMRSSLQQMIAIGAADIGDISFILPTDANFDTTPPANTDKVFHPAGGGVPMFTDGGAPYYDGQGTTGWVFQTATNVAWTETPATDLIVSFVNLHPAICAEINSRINGSDTIPTAAGLSAWADYLEEGGTDNTLDSTVCPACEGNVSLCVSNGTTNIFYNVVAQR